ncbi:MAG: ATP-dependent Clp protease ATP-binding subunit, partial [Bacteroidales bacterium]|nr:ATP-dependent Clp protease ATP-binding subunit [Bacteroidales bacterium]
QNVGIDYGKVLARLDAEGLLRAPERETPSELPPSPEEEAPAPEEKENASPLAEFGYDMTAAAAEGRLDPVIGREEQIERVAQILGRRRKNSPLLVGEPGVGKSAIVEGIAINITSGKVPPALKGKKIISLDIASVVAGTRYRGDFEKRLKDIIKEASSRPEVILFIDEFHTIVGAGGSSGSLDAANMLKPALARGEIQCIAATTLDEFTKIVEKDGALDRRFQKVMIEPADVAYSIRILTNLKEKYEEHHLVEYTPEAISACVRMSERYITDRCLPDKAIDVMDEAGSRVRIKGTVDKKLRGTHIVHEEDVAQIISQMTGIPAAKVAQGEGAKLLGMEEKLATRRIGQDEAISRVVRTIRRGRAGIKDPGRPIGSFIFFGPTGVGKTQLAKSIAEYLFDSEDNMVRIDMSEYNEKINISRLIGAPPGYVGFEEGGQLSEKVRRKPYCVVLLDEIEKAHPDVFNLLLQVLDEGRLTDSNGHVVNFRNTIVIMTSNVGSREVGDFGKGIGFTSTGESDSERKKSLMEKAVKKAFPPEFLNRIDEVVYFEQLSRESIEKIIDISLKGLTKRALDAGYRIRITEGAKKLVAEAGYDPGYGARPLGRAIQKYIEDPLSEFIIADSLAVSVSRDSGVRSLKVALSKDRTTTEVSAED